MYDVRCTMGRKAISYQLLGNVQWREVDLVEYVDWLIL